jgi:putative N6-adenine-specific DNA methylase
MMDKQTNNFQMLAKTFTGFEEVLASELTQLGASNVKIVKRGILFNGDKKLLYKANYLCRSALRILKPIASFRALNEDELYAEVGKINWEQYLGLDSTFSIDGITSYSNITHSKYLALKTKDAIVDQFRNKFGKRPNVNTENPDVSINVRVFRNEATISLDSSGESLHKRGYRVATGPAPMNEVLAAGLVLISGWNGKTNFIDPMCGSGTIPIEAALFARNIPSGYFREDYSFKKWNDFDPELWQQVVNEAKENIRDIQLQIVGSDWSGRILQAAKENVISAGLEDTITLRTNYIDDSNPPKPAGFLITNPPYGERIKTDDIKSLYKGIGDTLKKEYPGYTAWIISSHNEALKSVGLRPSRNIKVFNGQLECRFAKFEMYTGSKKQRN